MQNSFWNPSRFRSWFSWHNMLLFWYRSYRRFFLFLFIVMMIFGAWYWYYTLYQYAWDESTQKKFLESYAQETDFKEAVFEKAVSVAKERQAKYETGVSLEHDLFRLDKLPKEQ